MTNHNQNTTVEDRRANTKYSVGNPTTDNTTHVD